MCRKAFSLLVLKNGWIWALCVVVFGGMKKNVYLCIRNSEKGFSFFLKSELE